MAAHQASAVVEDHAGLALGRTAGCVMLFQVRQIKDARPVIKHAVGLCPELLVAPAPCPHGIGVVVPDAPVLHQLWGCVHAQPAAHKLRQVDVAVIRPPDLVDKQNISWSQTKLWIRPMERVLQGS